MNSGIVRHSKCGTCERLTKTEFIARVTPTMFGDIFFEGTVCTSCKEQIEYEVYRYSQLYNELTEKMSQRALKLDLKTKRSLK